MNSITSRPVIRTFFLGPTNYRGSRIKATCQAGSITVGLDYSQSGTEAHWHAALALLANLKLNWGNQYAIGQDDKGCYFIPIDPGYNVGEVVS